MPRCRKLSPTSTRIWAWLAQTQTRIGRIWTGSRFQEQLLSNLGAAFEHPGVAQALPKRGSWNRDSVNVRPILAQTRAESAMCLPTRANWAHRGLSSTTLGRCSPNAGRIGPKVIRCCLGSLGNSGSRQGESRGTRRSNSLSTLGHFEFSSVTRVSMAADVKTVVCRPTRVAGAVHRCPESGGMSAAWKRLVDERSSSTLVVGPTGGRPSFVIRRHSSCFGCRRRCEND